jgi:hypothetical protein
MDVLALPFADGVSERRSSFMAGLAHGRHVVTTVGEATGADLRKAGVFRASSVKIEEFCDLVGHSVCLERSSRESEGVLAREYYERNYGWARLAETIAGRLRGGWREVPSR